MKEKSFSEVFLRSFRLSFSHPLLFLWGAFLSFPVLLEQYFFSQKAVSFQTVDEISKVILPLLFLSALVSAFVIFGKAKLVILLDDISHAKKTSGILGLSLKKIYTLFCLLSVFFVLNLLFVFILCLPVGLFLMKTGEISLLLTTLAFLTFLPIMLVLFLIEEFSSFYILLAGIKMRDAMENSAKLFLQSWKLLARYTLAFLSVFLVFTILLNLVMLGVAALFEDQSQGILFGFIFVFSVWFTVVREAFFLTIFTELAGPKSTDVTSKEEVFTETILKDIPPA